MWRKIVEYFQKSPTRLLVAQALIRHGFSVEAPGVIRCRNIKIPVKSISDALGIDRRTVRDTTEDICDNDELFSFFRNILPAGPSLEKVSRVLNYGVVTIFVESPENPGILSDVTAMIAGYGIPIRQVLAEDIAIYPQPCLKVITEAHLPGAVIEHLTSLKGVSRVIIDK